MIFSDVPMLVEYTIHVRPLAKLEVLGLKTELTAGSEAVPFGVSGYDAEENEFDSLDGLQIQLKSLQQNKPLSHVHCMSSSCGAAPTAASVVQCRLQQTGQ